MQKKTRKSNNLDNKPQNSLGRPTKYKPEYCQRLVDHMAQGFSSDSFAGVVDVCIETIRQWKHKNPEFLAAYKRGCAARLLRDEQIYQTAMLGRPVRIGNEEFTINVSLLIFKMKSQHRWRTTEKYEHSIEPEGLERLQEASEKLQELGASELFRGVKEALYLPVPTTEESEED